MTDRHRYGETEVVRLEAVLERARERAEDLDDPGGGEAEANALLPNLLSELRRLRLQARRLHTEVDRARSELRAWNGRFGRRL